jgi:hypothetical protein
MFFSLYSRTSLFPVREPAFTNSTLRPVVASPILAATIVTEFDLSFDSSVQINLRVNRTNLLADDTAVVSNCTARNLEGVKKRLSDPEVALLL